MKSLSKNFLVVACPSLLVASLLVYTNNQNQTAEHHFEQMYAIDSIDSELSDMCDGYSVELVAEIHWDGQRVSEYRLSCNSQFDFQGKGFDGYQILRRYHVVSELDDSELNQPKRNPFLYIQREDRYGDKAYYKLDSGYGNAKLFKFLDFNDLMSKDLRLLGQRFSKDYEMEKAKFDNYVTWELSQDPRISVD